MEKTLDILVVGATGFTGKYVVKNLVHLVKSDKEFMNLKWGIAGRNEDKLKNLLEEINDMGLDATSIPVYEVNVTSEDSLQKATAVSKVVMNCTGPCTLLSEPIVRACIETRTHYVDISAEVHQILNVYHGYHKAAEEAGILIITACGFGSIPGVIGFVHLDKHFEGSLHSVDCYMELDIPRRAYYPGSDKTLVHYGTWASLVHELKNMRDKQELKKKLFPEPLLGQEPESVKKSFFHKHKGNCWFPYPGPDGDIIEMTQRELQEKYKRKAKYFNMYTTMPLFIHYLIIPVIYVYYYLSSLKCFRNLLWNYPRLFTLGYMSHKGPTDEMLEDMTFSFKFIGKGWRDMADMKAEPNKQMFLKVSGRNPYNLTAIPFIMAAVTILMDRENMPNGGVLTTGGAFYNTNLIQRLHDNGLNFKFSETF